VLTQRESFWRGGSFGDGGVSNAPVNLIDAIVWQLINYRHGRALTRVETDLSVSRPQPGDLLDFAPADRHTSLRALLCRTIRGPGRANPPYTSSIGALTVSASTRGVIIG